MRKIRIDKSDKYRVLLTDVLPYETPIFFSNEGFYRFSKECLAESAPVVRTILTGFKDGQHQDLTKLNSVPYGYDIRKGTLGTRTLSLIHPAVQLQIVSLYERFSHVILHLCGRSKFSLRHPASITSAIYGKENEIDAEDDTQCGSTFFKYENYDLVYRFFDSYEFLRLEKRFRHLSMFDISKCFNHIYTHTLSWAVRSKEFAKKNLRRNTFDGDFDAIMQAANHKETAGILIGPEVSRIFAEIILQRVDSSVERRLLGRMKCGLDYDVRRYVDDYYVFSRTHEIGEAVMRVYHEELKHYRLYFNEAKSLKMVVPFMTPISCAKVEISSILSTFFDSLLLKAQGPESADGTTTTRLRGLWNPGRKSNRLIQLVKSIVMSHNVEFASISGFLFAVIEKRLRRTLKGLASESTSDRELGEFLFAVLDVTFFIYAMDVRVSTTYKVGRIAIEACKAVAGRSGETNERIKKKIYDESRHILEAEVRGQPDFYVETVNLLAVIRVLGPEYRVASETIDKMLEIMDRERPDGNIVGIDYFLVTAIIFHIGDDHDHYYTVQKTNLLQRTLRLFKEAEHPEQHADFTCLFLDLLSCPFVDEKFKRQLTCNFKVEGRSLSDQERHDILAEVPSHQWFTDWRARDCIEVLLDKKRYQSAY